MSAWGGAKAAPPVWPMPGHRTVAETDKPPFLRAAARREQMRRAAGLKDQGLSQADIAERMGLSVSRVSQILGKAREQRADQVTDRDGVTTTGRN